MSDLLLALARASPQELGNVPYEMQRTSGDEAVVKAKLAATLEAEDKLKPVEISEQTKPATQATDFPESPWNAENLDRLKQAEGAKVYERRNPPFRALADGEATPTMAELWKYAHRRYSRYQGYAWGGVVVVGALAYFSARLQKSKP